MHKFISQCEICDRKFSCPASLKRHKSIHTGEKPFKCDTCGKGFSQMEYLKLHTMNHTGEKLHTSVIQI